METFQWSQSYGAGQTIVDLGESGNLFNFKSVDDATPGNYTDYTITASDAEDEGNSFEVFLRAHFTGTFNKIDNLQFWMSEDFDPNTGLSIKAKMNNVTYAQPTTDDSIIAVDPIPVADPGTANVSIGGNLAGQLTEAGYSDYICTQLHVGLTANSGDTSLAVYTLQYDVQ